MSVTSLLWRFQDGTETIFQTETDFDALIDFKAFTDSVHPDQDTGKWRIERWHSLCLLWGIN